MPAVVIHENIEVDARAPSSWMSKGAAHCPIRNVGSSRGAARAGAEVDCAESELGGDAT